MRHKIPPRKRSCSFCSTPFPPHSFYYTEMAEEASLRPKGSKKKREEQLLRADICPTCWLANNRLPEEAGKLFWCGKTPTKPETFDLPEAFKRAVELFYDYTAEEELAEERALECYCLALYLERQRYLRLRYEAKDEENRLWLHYEERSTKKMFQVRQIALSKVDWEALNDRMDSLLSEEKAI